MTWREFKCAVEDEGLKDDDDVVLVQWNIWDNEGKPNVRRAPWPDGAPVSWVIS